MNRLAALPVAVVAFVWAWVATGPGMLTLVNWDAGVYLAQCTTRQLTLASVPWNAHFAVGHIYVAGAALARLFGGSCIDGFRLADALAFAAAAAIVFVAARRLSASLAVALGATALWATGFAVSFELFTVEDNILFFPPAAFAVWLAAARFSTWRPRDSVYAGVAAAAAALVSWQAILYLGPGGYAALLGPGRNARQRARDVGIVVGTFFATLVVYCVILALVTPRPLKALLVGSGAGIFRPPSGNFDLRFPFIPPALRDLGAGLVYTLWHVGYDLPKHGPNLIAVALALLLVEALLLGAATRLAFRRGVWSPQVVALTALAFTVATPIYCDLPFRYLLRLDYLPLVAALGIAATFGALPSLRRYAVAAGLVLAAIASLQLAAGLRWDRARRLFDRSWYAFFTDVRAQHPACLYVFSIDELKESYWQFEIPALASTELPRYVAVGDPARVRKWRFPLDAATTADVARDLPSCAWISPDAGRVMSLPPAK